MLVREYASRVADESGCTDPCYLHNTGFLTDFPQLASDLAPFVLDYIPGWYAHKWWRHTQFFWGPKNSLTPLHFDSLGTHNLFFQLQGRKRFFVIPAKDRKYCHMRNFFWSDVDVESPDLKKYPEFAKAEVSEYELEAGDAIYLPPFTLHQVRGLEQSFSLNIDWHTRGSVINGLASGLFQGMPRSRIQYNLCYFLGLILGVPSAWLYPMYEKYLR